MSNRREYFRVEFYKEYKAEIETNNEIATAYINDISTSGISFETNYELFFKQAKLTFQLENKEFEREIEIVRKINLDSGATFYAAKFINFNEKQRAELFQTLLRIDSKKKRGYIKH